VTHVLLWDIDGTLLTTGRAGVFALEEAARALTGTPIDLATMHTAGLTDAEIARSILESADASAEPDDVNRFLRAYEELLPERLHWRRGRVLDGVRELLEFLHVRRDVLNVLLTGNTRAGAAAKLSHYGLGDFFVHGAFADDADDRAGIAAQALELAREAASFDVDLEQVFVIGDTPRDIACAGAIGARSIAVAGTYPADELREAGAWLVLDGLPEPLQFAEIVGLR
jgi:phosphoglycolate phosphatase-like HAD superfamily hydrolase